jgi:curved DNA-binding protein CbpA
VADYYAILGVSRQATTGDVRQAYLKLARDRHPDKFSDPGEKERAQQAFQEMTAAFNTLSNERERRVYDQSLERPSASTPEERALEAFALAQSSLEVQNFAEAAAHLRAAVHHAPHEAKYQAALGRILARSPQSAREAVEAFEHAVRLQPRVVSHYIELADLLLRQGLRLRARKIVEAALRLAPHDARLQALVQELDLDSAEGGGLKGLLRRKP